MGVRFTVRSNIAEITATARAQQRAVSFATVKALTRTGVAIKDAMREEMRRVFDRPTPYTLNSTFLKPATKVDPTARVWIKDDRAGSGTPPEKFLGPQIMGGTRNRRAAERNLERLLVVPSGWFIVPGSEAKIDQYGNWSVGEIKQVLSWFKASQMTSGYSANLTPERRAKLKRGTRRRRGFEYFAVRPQDAAAKWLHPGIYRKTKFAFGGAIQPIALFVQSVSYKQRLDFFGVAERVALREFSSQLRRAIDEERAR